ncbi:hypothetical protein [Halomonas heilongjiangensis]|uniref:2TM domain-containing protein n=1 Tax=Halomonas heilongjiangensis TaxID=1387883 RepID=A0A2N7TJE8_9GAMM|nr:hypothetical protein [Halomonas heilongjiangensis]PMR68323.1 hypothetical protein C1H66_15620 [Halomonas heilongjiangensis]PXX89057.1 hypothetical protein CR158_11690 [Halomonas heilongjiangensis]
MPADAPLVASSPRRHRRELLTANRFLGLHQALHGLWVSALVLGILNLIDVSPAWWWWLPAYPLSWAVVELLFLPRRQAIALIAEQASRGEVASVALKHGVMLRDVRVVD